MSVDRVVIIQTDRPVPVYHRFDNVIGVKGDYVDLMACGQQRNERTTWFSAWLRREHADLFARPCSRCFPADGETP